MLSQEMLKLTELDSTNNEIVRIKEKLNGRSEKSAKNALEKETAEKKLNAKKAELEELSKAQREIDLNIKSNQQKINEKQIKLNTVKSQRDYDLINQEIESLKLSNEKSSNDGLKNIDKIETLKNTVEELGKDFENLKKEEEKILKDEEAEKKELKEMLVSLEEKAEGLKKEISPKNLTLYNRLFEKYGDKVVVKIEDGVCGGCFFTLPPQFINSVAIDEEVKTCLNCVRIVYSEE